MSYYSPEKPENNRRIQNNGTFKSWQLFYAGDGWETEIFFGVASSIGNV